MSTVTIQPFSGLYRAQPAPSTFAFAVRHSGVFWFRGSLSDVEATLHADGDALVLEGSARRRVHLGASRRPRIAPSSPGAGVLVRPARAHGAAHQRAAARDAGAVVAAQFGVAGGTSREASGLVRGSTP